MEDIRHVLDSIDWDVLREQRRLAEGIGPLHTQEQIKSEKLNSRGWKFYCKGKLRKAIRYFQKSVKLNPRNAAAFNNQGLALQKLYRREEAMECYQKAVDIAPRFVKPYVNIGNLLLLEGRISDAAWWFRQALRIEPDYIPAQHGLEFYCHGEKSLLQKIIQEVIPFVNEIQDHSSLLCEAVLLLESGSYQQACEKFLKIEQTGIRLPTILLVVIGECLCRVGEYDKASVYVRRAIENDPNTGMVWTALSFISLGRNQFQECIQYAKKALKLDPEDDMAMNNLGAAYLFLGRYREAREALEQALKINPNNFRAEMNLNACLRKIQKPDKFYMGDHHLRSVESDLQRGKRVQVVIDFLRLERKDWDRLIFLTNWYENLSIRDLRDRPAEEMMEFAHFFQKMGMMHLALDFFIEAYEKKRRLE